MAMEDKEKELTPQESIEVMQRMVRQAEATAHFTGQPFLTAGVCFVVTFLTMAVLYAVWPERNWTWVLFLYVVLHFVFWHRSLPKKGSPQTLAERVIGEVWSTGEGMIFGTILFGCLGINEHNWLVPPILLLFVTTIVCNSSYTNDDEWGYRLSTIGIIGALGVIFNGTRWTVMTWGACLYYAVLFAVVLLGTGWRWTYLAKHPEKRKTMVIDVDDDE
ncbi:MAG: hypothetical protein IJ197_00905 [Bacteroidaceae bacterium]|nr:hypothetical protein [Bacteroidaceae bacterium]